jgi:hypothetical protein
MITPEYLAKSGSEHGEQTALFCWCRLNVGKYPELGLLFAIPNGGSRGKAEAGRLKAEGVRSGVSDLMLPVARGGYHGAFVEMKRPGQKASNAQLEWGRLVTDQGYAFIVCDNWSKAAQFLTDYLFNYIKRSK